MKKITFLSLHLGYGGIEKSVVAVANLLCHDYEVEIVSVYKLYDEPAFKLDKRVKVTYLIEKYKPNKEEWKDSIKKLKPLKFIKESYISVITLFLRQKTMIKAIKECRSDYIISTRELFNKWLGEYGSKKSILIGWEHNHHHGDISYANKVVKSVWNLDYLITVSDSLRHFYKLKLKESKCRCLYIPNILDEVPEKHSKLTEKRLISIGRLSREKGFDDLIEVFKLVHEKRPEWTLDIIGDGAQKNLIGDKIYSYNLNDFVKLHGYQKKDYINKYLSKSSIYIMTSFTESFGIVLLEAMSYGIPCVAFSSAEGANDLIKDNYNGYLIKNRDKEKMADAIISLIDNEEKRVNLGENGYTTSLNFTSDKVKKDWLKLLKK